MDEYISREAVIDMLHRHSMMSNSISEIARIAGIKRAVREIPTADVVEVRQGHWEWFEEWIPSTPDNVRECEDCGWRCSECKTALEDAVGGYWDDVTETPELHYCPNCGAIMDGKRVSK